MRNANHEKIIWTFRLFTKIDDFNIEYNLEEIYSNSQQLESD